MSRLRVLFTPALFLFAAFAVPAPVGAAPADDLVARIKTVRPEGGSGKNAGRQRSAEAASMRRQKLLT